MLPSLRAQAQYRILYAALSHSSSCRPPACTSARPGQTDSIGPSSPQSGPKEPGLLLNLPDQGDRRPGSACNSPSLGLLRCPSSSAQGTECSESPTLWKGKQGLPPGLGQWVQMAASGPLEGVWHEGIPQFHYTTLNCHTIHPSHSPASPSPRLPEGRCIPLSCALLHPLGAQQQRHSGCSQRVGKEAMGHRHGLGTRLAP